MPARGTLSARSVSQHGEGNTMGRIGPTELLIILLILVVLFGATKIPQLGRGLGEAFKNFSKGLRGGDAEDEPEPPPPPRDPS